MTMIKDKREESIRRRKFKLRGSEIEDSTKTQQTMFVWGGNLHEDKDKDFKFFLFLLPYISSSLSWKSFRKT